MGEDFTEEDLDAGDVLEDADDGDENGREREDSIDLADLKPMDAFLMKMEDLVTEMERRHLHPKGFFNDDAKELQKYFDQEHFKELEKIKEERREQRQRSRMKAQLQKKRLQLEKQLREEQDAVANDPQIEAWLSVVRSDQTRPSARIGVNSVTARALAKAMWNNKSLTSLDLSRNDLSDFAGAQIGRMLKRNAALVKLELNENRLGPRACHAFGEALHTNGTLKTLSLESNPLTNESTDQTGVVALAQALSSNASLTLLNLWRCDLGTTAGAELAKALHLNSSIIHLDVGNNGVLVADKRRIADKVDANKKETRAIALQNHAFQEQLRKEAAGRQAIADEEQKARELEEWMDAQKDLRAAERMAEADAEREKRREEERVKAEAERVAREEKKAKEEAAKKKKGKKGKKGKK